MIRSFRQCVLVAALVLVLPLLPSCASVPPSGLEKLEVANHNLALQLLPPPPALGSPEQDADRASVEYVSSRRTITEQATALFESSNFLLCAFATDIGPFFTSNTFSNTFVFFRQVQAATDRVTDVGKAYWNRARPFQLYPDLPVLYLAEKTPGYPSGHSTRGTVFAILLAELFPEHKEAILARGRQLGWDRVRIAMHFPTDVYAGRVLGQAIVRELWANKAFQKGFEGAKSEVATWRARAHLGPGPAAGKEPGMMK